MKLGILMDPLEKLKTYKDTTLVIIKRALKMGWSCQYFTLQDLFCENGRAYAYVSDIRIGDENSVHWPKVSLSGQMALSEFDIILMRKDPPFDMEYIYATYALELAEKEGVLIASHPQSLRDANEKFFTLNFPQCCPKTLVSRNIKHLREFWSTHRSVVFKPLAGMGGREIFHVDENDHNLSVILEVLTHQQTVSVMAQVYIPEIQTTGDKRIILINGEPVPFALARIPAAGELRGNIDAGGTGKIVELTERDRWICGQISPALQAKGLYLAGIDVIGDYLTEINVTSPSCIREIEVATNIDIAGDYLHFLESQCHDSTALG